MNSVPSAQTAAVLDSHRARMQSRLNASFAIRFAIVARAQRNELRSTKDGKPGADAARFAWVLSVAAGAYGSASSLCASVPVSWAFIDSVMRERN
jgi:hypothetical protein